MKRLCIPSNLYCLYSPVLQSLHEELEKIREEKSSAVESLKERMEKLAEREGKLTAVEEELSDVKKLLSEKTCREQELEEMSEKQRRSLEELSQKHESLQSELNAVHTAREEEVDGRETLTALQSTLSAKDEEILRLKEDLDQHMKDLTLTQEKLQVQFCVHHLCIVVTEKPLLRAHLKCSHLL